METELPKRKSIRLTEYDYSQNGAYFITLCTQGRKNLFSSITETDCETPQNTLTSYGEAAKLIIEALPDRFHISIPKYIIMPNHIHLLVEITDSDGERAIRESPLRRPRSTIDKMVGFLKMNVSKKIGDTYTGKVWQRSYHDHIIRKESDYLKIWEYIDNNPTKWEEDCFYESPNVQL